MNYGTNGTANTNGNVDREALVDKIRKLLALSTSPNQHEAELAASRASDIMTKYQIAMAEVLIKDAANGRDPIIVRRYIVPNLKLKLHYVETIAQASALLFDASILVGRQLHGTSVTWVGKKGDVDSAQAMFEYLWASWQTLVVGDLAREKSDRAYYRKPNMTPGEVMRFKQGHGVAFSSTIYWRCSEEVNRRKEVVKASGSSGMELVVVKDAEMKEWMEANSVKSARTKQSAGGVEGRRAGSKAANNIDLGIHKKIGG